MKLSNFAIVALAVCLTFCGCAGINLSGLCRDNYRFLTVTELLEEAIGRHIWYSQDPSKSTTDFRIANSNCCRVSKDYTPLSDRIMGFVAYDFRIASNNAANGTKDVMFTTTGDIDACGKIKTWHGENIDGKKGLNL